VIQNFTCKETAKIFSGIYSRKFPADIQPRTLVKLEQIANATAIDQLHIPPSNHLEQLSGKLKHYSSIRINKQWRIIFQWQDNHATNVQITDYH
jgi:toxin HigB-1